MAIPTYNNSLSPAGNNYALAMQIVGAQPYYGDPENLRIAKLLNAMAHIESEGGGATWGMIVGTLANQTDLQTALNLKANATAVVPSIAGTAGQVLINGATAAVAGSAVTASLAAAIYSLTSVGIGTGTTAAVTGLQVVDTGTATPRGIINDQYNAGTNSAQMNLRKARGTFAAPTVITSGDILGRLIFWGSDNSTPSAFVESGNIRCTSSGTIGVSRLPSQLEFYTSTDALPSVLTQALLINNAQQSLFQAAVGIGTGTTAPVTQLQVVDTVTTSPRGIMTSQYNTGTDGARLHMRKARGTFAAPLIVASGDNLGRLVASGCTVNGGGTYLEMASIIFGTEGTIGLTQLPTNIVFQTATNAAPSVLTTALTINSAQLATFAASVLVSGATEAGAGTGSVVLTGGISVAKAIRTESTTASTSAITGSIIALGGVGVGGALYVGGAAGNVAYPANFVGTPTANFGVIGLRAATDSSYCAIEFWEETGASEVCALGWGNSTVGAVLLRDKMYIYSSTTISFFTNNTASTAAATLSTAGALVLASSITTSAPNTGTAGAWKLGILVTAVVTPDTSRYIQLDVGGTLYKLIISS